MRVFQTMAEVWRNRPKLIIHGRLQNCGSVRELADLAVSKGFEIEVHPSGFMHDVKLHEGSDASAPLRNHTVRSARRFLELHPGAN